MHSLHLPYLYSSTERGDEKQRFSSKDTKELQRPEICRPAETNISNFTTPNKKKTTYGAKLFLFIQKNLQGANIYVNVFKCAIEKKNNTIIIIIMNNYDNKNDKIR